MRASRLLLLLTALPVWAHDPITTKLTWSAEISRIVYKRCGGCHREGGSAPMALVHYAEARPWAKAIKEEVLERRMPPWGAVKGFGDFSNDASLTQEELHTLADWVEGGAPEGDPNLLPEEPFVAKPAPLPALTPLPAVLSKTTSIAAVRAEGFPENAALRVAAQLPDGRVEPLVWIYGFREKHRPLYVYRKPLTLPARTRIVFSPEIPGRLLFSAKPSPAR